jgi:2,3-bisphosphoglycerate-dependent phosphoglycerate mutase
VKIILLRHGESEWNSLNKFTGWTDVDLTLKGIDEAKFSARQILLHNIAISSVNTSLLSRAINTAKIVCEILNFDKDKIKYNWELNERHYGALQGLSKSETATKYGEDQVHIWRRSYDIPPPKISEEDKRHPKLIDKFRNINEDLPVGESLKDVIDRLLPFWKEYSNNLKKGTSNLIVAHSNSLRAIIKILEEIDDKKISLVNIPTGIPLVYNLDKNLKVIHKEYLIDDIALEEKQSLVINQGKALNR